MTKRKLDECFNEEYTCAVAACDQLPSETSPPNNQETRFGYCSGSPSGEQHVRLIPAVFHPSATTSDTTTSAASTTTGGNRSDWKAISPPTKRVSLEDRDSAAPDTPLLAHHQTSNNWGTTFVKVPELPLDGAVESPVDNQPASETMGMKQKRNSCGVDADSCSSDQDLCRICQIGEEDGSDSPLISPCRCTGSVKYVHQTCLQKWIKGNDIKSCELCKYEFKMHTKLKPFSKWEKLDMTTSERRKILCSIGFHLLAVTCVIWSLYVLIQRTAQEIRQKEFHWPFWTKLIVVAIGFVGGLVFMYVQCKVYVQLWRRLKAYNRVIYVQNNPTLTTSNPNSTSATNKKTTTTAAPTTVVSGSPSRELQTQTQQPSSSATVFNRSDGDYRSKQITASRLNNNKLVSNADTSNLDRDDNQSGRMQYMCFTPPGQQVVSPNQYQINFEDQPSCSSNRPTHGCLQHLSMPIVSPSSDGTSHAFNSNGNVEISIERPDLTDTTGGNKNISNSYKFLPINHIGLDESVQQPGENPISNQIKSDFVVEMGACGPNVNSDTFSDFGGSESLAETANSRSSSSFAYPESEKSPICGKVEPTSSKNQVGCTIDDDHDQRVGPDLLSLPRRKSKQYQVLLDDSMSGSCRQDSLTTDDTTRSSENISTTHARSATDV